MIDRIPPFARGMLLIAVVSAVIVVLHWQTSLDAVSLLVSLAFFLGIVLIVYVVWRDFGRREIAMWPARSQWTFYGAAGLLVVDLAWFFVRGVSGPDALVFFLVAGASIYAGVRTWRDQNRYG